MDRCRVCVSVLLAATAVTATATSAQSARDEAVAREASAIRHLQRGEFAEALAEWRSALRLHQQTRNLRGQAASLSGIGGVHLSTGELDSAFANYRIALATARSVGFDSAASRILTGLGASHAAAGRVDSALTYYGLSIAAARRARDIDNEALGLQNIGSVYSGLRRTDSAIVYLRDALSRFELSRGDWARRGEAMALSSLGATHFLAGSADTAAILFDRALAIRRSLGDLHGQALSFGHLAAVHEEAGDLDTAVALLDLALPLHQRTGNTAGEAYVLRKLGLIAARRDADGDFASGIVFLGLALELAREAGDSAEIALALQHMATAWRRIGSFERAVAYYDSAAAIYSRLRRHVGSDANAVSFGESEQFAYWPWALALLQLDDPIRAWAVAERGRAQAVLDLMSPAARLRAYRPDAVAAAHADPEREAADLWRSLKGDSAYVLFYLQAGDTLVLWLMTPQGELPFSIASIQQDRLARFIGTLRAGLGAESARLGMARGRDQERPARGLDLSAGDDNSETLRVLGELLLPADVLSRVPAGAEIVIVPHGPLGLVPFAALPLDGDSVPFGLRHPLRYAPSLRSLLAASARPAPASGSPVIVVGNPPMPEITSANGERVRLSELPAAAAEAGDIARRLGTTPWTGSDASEDRVRRALPAAGLVHLATHGLAFGSESRVRDSYVALAPDAAHDGLLTLGEIMDDDGITLVAELVVLSACQTGLGNLKQAEGTVGLQRSLLAKGARSVLVSLWSVDDDATRVMMQSFYEHWLAGASKAEALRRAQLSVRANRDRPQWSDARYWAAFQLVGAR